LLDRYIFREVAATWLAVSGVLLVILVSNQLARVLTQAAANDFPRGVVLALIGLTSAGYLSVVVPIGFFLAILLALGRLYHESEMAAIQSCGVGPAGLYRPIALLGAAIFGLLVWLSFWGIPGATARAKELRAEALRDAQFGSLEPGRFRTFAGGRVVFYAERVDDNKILHNVHVFVERPAEKAQGKSGDAVASSRSDDADKLEIWVATRAEQRGAGQAEQTFVLYDGERYEGSPGSGEFRIIEFAEGGIPIRLGEIAGGPADAEMKPTRALLASDEPKDRAELQWRMSTPLLAMILMVLAVPLARLRPRQGRFGRIGVAILAFFLYYQMLVAARTWVENDVVPSFLGLWWVHGVALGVALALLLRESPPTRIRVASEPA
jgi:lipopolysaccharide export system permease protein